MIDNVYHLPANELMASLPDESIDCVLTDPPYGLRYDSGHNDYFRRIAGDDALPTDWLADAYRVLKQGSALYVFAHWRTWGEIYAATLAAGFNVKNMIVLNKSNHGMGDLKGAYSPKHELLMFATKGRHLPNWPEGRNPDVFDAPVIFTRSHRRHSCEKPTSWLTPFILNSTRPGDVVLDPFTGSGSVPAACVETDRRYIACDIDYDCVMAAKLRLGQLPATAPTWPEPRAAS